MHLILFKPAANPFLWLSLGMWVSMFLYKLSFSILTGRTWRRVQHQICFLWGEKEWRLHDSQIQGPEQLQTKGYAECWNPLPPAFQASQLLTSKRALYFLLALMEVFPSAYYKYEILNWDMRGGESPIFPRLQFWSGPGLMNYVSFCCLEGEICSRRVCHSHQSEAWR